MFAPRPGRRIPILHFSATPIHSHGQHGMSHSKKSGLGEVGFLRLDGRRRSPLFVQLYEGLRDGILDGRLKPNCRIPSSRDLTDQLGVSRTTVISALDRLIAEGYLQSAVGSGTFVSSELPEEAPFKASQAIKTNGAGTGSNSSSLSTSRQIEQGLSRMGCELAVAENATLHSALPKPLCPGEPALDAFPTEVWLRILRKVWKRIGPIDLSYGEPAGLYSLRKSVAEYLRSHRGVNCETQQVMIVNGTQQAVDIVARVVLNPGDGVLFENPGYASAREALAKQGAAIIPIPVDEHGAVVRQGIERTPSAKLAYVTPSHQYPLGVTMSLERRLELLDWAAKPNRWILEDDYDSEYRYGQRPIPAMQGLDSSNSTFYVGSFSKVVFPALSLGYVIVPSDLVDIFESALRLASRPAAQIDQHVLSEFIRGGHFSRHLRRMRKLHAERRSVLVEELESKLSDRLTIMGSKAGLHCTALLKSKKSDYRVVEELSRAGIISRSLSDYYLKASPRSSRLKGLVLGFACATPAQIRKTITQAVELV